MKEILKIIEELIGALKSFGLKEEEIAIFIKKGIKGELTKEDFSFLKKVEK